MGIIPTSASKIRGVVTITLSGDGEGEVRRAHNLVTDAGLNLILNRLLAASPSPLGYIAIGSGTGAFPGNETAMYDEVYRKGLTSMEVTGNVGLWRTYFSTVEANCTIREIGLTNAAGSGAGTLISHVQVSPPVVKINTKEMTVDIQHIIERS